VDSFDIVWGVGGGERLNRLKLSFLLLLVSSCTLTGVYVWKIREVSKIDRGGFVPLRVVTANIPIARGINLGSSTRLAHTSEFVRDLYEKNDIVCLQEVWEYDDKSRIVREMGLTPDKYYFDDTRGLGETGKDYCDGGVSALRACVEHLCVDLPVEDQTICAKNRCKFALGSLMIFQRHCADCLVAMVGHPVGEIILTCSRLPGRSRVYGGGNGLILLSKHGLYNRSYEMLPASSANRIVLYAEVRVPGTLPIDIGCTHLSSEELFPPTHSGFDSWDDERRAQLDTIGKGFDQRSSTMTRLLIGDMNFGPDKLGEVNGFSESIWRYSEEIGYRSPIAYTDPVSCSYCAGNLLRYDDSEESYLVDHVLYHPKYNRSGLVPVFARTLATPLISVCVRKKRGSCVEMRDVHLSDHVPVQVGFTFTGTSAY
jgi:hypothetical protein